MRRILLAVLLGSLLAGCGSTKIVTKEPLQTVTQVQTVRQVHIAGDVLARNGRDSYETGNFSQWTLHQWTGSDQGYTINQLGNTKATIVTSPRAQGNFAAKFQTFSTGGGTSTANRAEVYIPEAKAGGTPGQDWWYGWWTRFPSGQTFWPLSHDFNGFTQMNEQGGSRWVFFGVDSTHVFTPTTNLYANTVTGHHVLVPALAFDRWYHFVVHLRWATDSSGYLTVFIDGSQILDDHGPTLPAANPHGVISQGYYTARSASNTVYHDGFCRASSQAAAAACDRRHARSVRGRLNGSDPGRKSG